jgi:hypothetical protein
MELTELAEKYSKEHHDKHLKAQGLAGDLVKNYATYLSAPLSVFQFIRLNGHLEKTDQTAKIEGSKVPLVFAAGGWWHFCFSIKFARGGFGHHVTETNKMSLRIEDNGRIKVREADQEFEIDPAKPDMNSILNAHLFRSSKTGMSRNFGEPSSKIGFLATDG